MKARLKMGDALLLAGLLMIAALGGIWWLMKSVNAADSSVSGYVVTQTKDGFYRADPLDSNVSYTVETPGTGFGEDAEQGLNTVRISRGTVEVESANCGNQVCVEHDAIAKAGEQIVCLPHGLVIEVVKDKADVRPLQ